MKKIMQWMAKHRIVDLMLSIFCITIVAITVAKVLNDLELVHFASVLGWESIICFFVAFLSSDKRKLQFQSSLRAKLPNEYYEEVYKECYTIANKFGVSGFILFVIQYLQGII